ncbi:MAG: TRAP transporter large permease [Desulfatiglandales bacterium]
MEWPFILLIIFGALVVLMLSGMPVAFCFMLINVVGMYVFFGGLTGLENLIDSVYTSLNTFILLPIPLFILMGEIMFHSGIAPVLIETIDKWLGRLPGRLSLLSVGAGTLFSTLTGTSLASVALLGSSLSPEMEKRGYRKSMSLGPILGSGGLAMMIPPSALAVLCGAIAEISIGRILIAIIIPGLTMAFIYAAYIVVRCRLQPSIAPHYEIAAVPFSAKVMATVKYVVPQGVVVFLVVGVIFLGVATPSEAAATGAIGTMVVASFYGRLNWRVIKKSIRGTLSVSGMICLILASAAAFSQILAFSGATAGLTNLAKEVSVQPMVLIIFMQIVVLFLGGFLDVVSIMMVSLPIFVPIVRSLGFDPVWFAVLFLINIEVAGISPPFGMSLFVMKGVTTEDTTMMDIYMAALPFVGLSLLAMVMIMIFPAMALWLPAMMF